MNEVQTKIKLPPQPSRFVSTFHSAVVGSNPKHTIYAVSSYSQILYYIYRYVDQWTNINKKGMICPIFQTKMKF